MKKFSLVIITKNAARLLPAALESGNFADEMLVLDSGSTDQTRAIAAAHGARVETQEWLGFGAQKNKAVSLAAHDWVFVLDADERIPPALRAEILRALRNPKSEKICGYEVPRLNYFFGAAIKTCGLYPDYTVRLFDRRRGRFTHAPVHERAQIAGRTAKLQNPMLHLAYDTVAQFIAKQNAYAQLSGKKRNMRKALFSPGWTFFKRYVLQLGFTDGWRGFVICKLYAQYTFWKYIK